jgi:hypothetical protein
VGHVVDKVVFDVRQFFLSKNNQYRENENADQHGSQNEGWNNQESGFLQ